MDEKRAVLKRLYSDVKTLLEDAKKLESEIDSINDESALDDLILTGNSVVKKLVDNLKTARKRLPKIRKNRNKHHDSNQKTYLDENTGKVYQADESNEESANESNSESPVVQEKLVVENVDKSPDLKEKSKPESDSYVKNIRKIKDVINETKNIKKKKSKDITKDIESNDAGENKSKDIQDAKEDELQSNKDNEIDKTTTNEIDKTSTIENKIDKTSTTENEIDKTSITENEIDKTTTTENISDNNEIANDITEKDNNEHCTNNTDKEQIEETNSVVNIETIDEDDKSLVKIDNPLIGRIKLIDINKLVDENSRGSSSQKDDSVVIISDSDTEIKPSPKVTKKSHREKRRETRLTRHQQNVEYVSIEDDSDLETGKSTQRKSKRISNEQSVNKENGNVVSLKKDKKITSKCFVALNEKTPKELLNSYKGKKRNGDDLQKEKSSSNVESVSGKEKMEGTKRRRREQRKPADSSESSDGSRKPVQKKPKTIAISDEDSEDDFVSVAKTNTKKKVKLNLKNNESDDSDLKNSKLSNNASTRSGLSKGRKAANKTVLPEKKAEKSKDVESDSDEVLSTKSSVKKRNEPKSDDSMGSDIDSKKSDTLKKKPVESDESEHEIVATKSSGKKKAKRVVQSESEGSDFKAEVGDSDESQSEKQSGSEEVDEEEDNKKKQKLKRIKRVANDDSSSGEEGNKKEKGDKKDDNKTRKKIRNIITKKSLNQSTLEAEQAEQDRKNRIAERQKKYNEIYNETDVENAVLDKVVLDINEDTNEEVLSVHKDIVKHLKPHQAKGVQFMWNACFESIDMSRKTMGSGCILAHCMGLGKTLQVITLVHTLLTNEEETGVTKVMVVCPLSTVLNWVAEFEKWLPDDEIEVFDLVSCKQVSERSHKVAHWHRNGGVMIIGYDMYRNLSNPDNKRVTKKVRTTFVQALVDPGPDLVVCDEGHLLKNEKTSLSLAMNRLRTLRRIVLTGTPLQNNLKEYFCMVQFVKPNLLGTYKEYLNRFVNPITNGQYTDSTPMDISVMRKRSHVLHKLLDGIVQRRDYAVLAPYLPPKHEYVLFVTLSQTQIQLYDHYLREMARQVRVGNTKGVSLFKDFQEFQRICTHPRVLLDKSIIDQNAKWKDEEENDTDGTEGSLKDFIDDDESTASSTSEDDGSGGDSSNSDKPIKKRGKAPPTRQRTTRAHAAEQGIDVQVDLTSGLEVANSGDEWWREFAGDEQLDDPHCSSKLALLFEILHQCEVIGDKILIFSQSLFSLNVIEYFLSKIDEASQTGKSEKVGGYSSSWSLGLDYFRLDGSSSCDNRALWCKLFNNPKNTRARLFLISTRAGGLGINLVAANRVIIFDVSWNPSHDVQSIYRVYRFGQTKPSYVYRFVSNGTMEMKVYERQVTKQAISKRVIDEQQIDRHYNQSDLAELYNFEPKPEGTRPIPLVPKDVLLGELLHDKPDVIYKYHEHHSLLENKEDEVLNENERRLAWEEFENEKKMRQMPQSINNIPINIIMAGFVNIVQRDNPAYSPAEVNALIPSMVQEMQEQMALQNLTLYNRVIEELRRMQQQQQVIQQKRLQEYYKLQQQSQQSQQRMLIEQQRQLMQNNAASYLQQLYARSGGANPMNPMNPNNIETINLND